jgi:hypothetical protein
VLAAISHSCTWWLDAWVIMGVLGAQYLELNAWVIMGVLGAQYLRLNAWVIMGVLGAQYLGLNAWVIMGLWVALLFCTFRTRWRRLDLGCDERGEAATLTANTNTMLHIPAVKGGRGEA